MRYQVEISKENQLLFKVDIEGINQSKCETSLETVLAKFPKTEGYQRHLLLSNSETRYLKSTENHIEVLAAVPVFKSLGEQ
ncbi:hypothetical protein BCT47_00065 [Vibrio splendidus]|uniref:Uncharacterized protein n=1 Tax=Vibrio splendidus TaxID=29497 RepID=A0AB35MVJ8_VIBSP|nr:MULTISPECIES: hypothetical protein [Vibrio]MBE8564675.1 hypothetical protein [Vibrio sp. OPT20]MDH5918357.1 hypothetical protein [Vibrio splendidus]MDH5976460.1 hypothetical protein [Vibrio splendidus]MDP2500784.1 hypothetical protein [Vibrio splendidus]PMM77864.1 hypothetical protein BCT47_00065 [Vibrio splendidus]